MPNLYVHDPRVKWFKPSTEAAKARGFNVGPLTDKSEGYALMFPHAHPETLRKDQALAQAVDGQVKWITDLDQIMLYEDKRGQTRKYHKWMPDTWIFEDEEQAENFVEGADYPLISKADVGASSYNVRLLKNKNNAVSHVREIFSDGVKVQHCDSLGTKSMQKGYVILQEFIPHTITYRVNIIGDQAAIFYRYCYPDKPMAQTGNVKPAYEPDEDLLKYARKVAKDIDSKWVALDILKTGKGYKLLETSLRWPWPSPGDCDNGLFFPCGKKWIEMWDVLMDEIEAGNFG